MLIEAFEPAHLEFRDKNPNVGGRGAVDLLYTLDDLRNDFAPLKATLATYDVVTLNEGEYHRGEGAVVRAIFHKE